MNLKYQMYYSSDANKTTKLFNAQNINSSFLTGKFTGIFSSASALPSIHLNFY